MQGRVFIVQLETFALQSPLQEFHHTPCLCLEIRTWKTKSPTRYTYLSKRVCEVTLHPGKSGDMLKADTETHGLSLLAMAISE